MALFQDSRGGQHWAFEKNSYPLRKVFKKEGERPFKEGFDTNQNSDNFLIA